MNKHKYNQIISFMVGVIFAIYTFLFSVDLKKMSLDKESLC